jgi:group II intron reverse transcriptase/maturase
MAGTPILEGISTKLQRIAQLAREDPKRSFLSLAHHIDLEWLTQAYRLTRKSGAPGVDGQTAADYAQDLESNLRNLLDRFKSGRYHAPPVRRVHLSKPDGKTRPIGIPTFEDKVLQRAVAMVLEAVYEQDFLDCSYGFRPGRSAHQALNALRGGLMEMKGGWVIDIDIQSFFDTLDHGQLREFLNRRVRDGVLRRAIDKWLTAGVLEAGALWRPEAGTPQGGVISPLLANVYLHEVVDQWFQETVGSWAKGRALLVRYADDMIAVFSREDDALGFLRVLAKRLGKFGLTLHPEKTRLVKFQRPPHSDHPSRNQRPGTFDLLGFTHYWGRSRRGYWIVRRKTVKSRFRRSLQRVSLWCRQHRHRPVAWQRAQLARKLQGYYNYYGITGNYRALSCFLEEVQIIWRKWLDRRSQRRRMSYETFNRVISRYPLPRPKIVHTC